MRLVRSPRVLVGLGCVLACLVSTYAADRSAGTMAFTPDATSTRSTSAGTDVNTVRASAEIAKLVAVQDFVTFFDFTSHMLSRCAADPERGEGIYVVHFQSGRTDPSQHSQSYFSTSS